MQAAVDLHMHSCLSPCGDEEMTPNNIVGMAAVKGLDIISVTDHNSARNAPAIAEVAAAFGVAFLPGVEVQTREDVHLLAYFRTVSELCAFCDFLYDHLPGMENVPAFFGEQQVRNADDEVIDTEPRLLLQSADLSLDALVWEIDARGGVSVPAHINKQANSLIEILGFIPENLPFAALEASSKAPMTDLDTGGRKILFSSDAHQLCDISEREHFLTLPEPTAEALFDDLLRRRKAYAPA